MESIKKNRWKSIGGALLGLLSVAMAFAIAFSGMNGAYGVPSPGSEAVLSAPSSSSPTATPTPTPTGTPTMEPCEPEYVQVGARNAGNKSNDQFQSEVEKAVTAAAVAAASKDEGLKNALLGSSKDALFMAQIASGMGLIKPEEVNELWPQYVADGCLSLEGQLLFAEMKGAFNATGTTFALEDAPASGVNSGVFDGVFGVAEVGGIYGDRTAIKVTFADGTSMWVLVRCGNLVFAPGKVPPGLPKVPTDNPPPPAPPEPPVVVEPCPWDWSLPVGHPNCVQPKTPSEDPYQNGNGDDGGGENYDPGPGEYTERPESPPEAPYVPPAPPAPEPPAPGPGPDPAPVPEPDPAPAPEPEPEAPPVPEPETGCVPIPGVEDCS